MAHSGEVKKMIVVVVAGPSGSGKSSLIQRILQDFPEHFGFSVSHTTRQPRDGEVDGKQYYFVTKEEMEQKIREQIFIETANYAGNTYGTSYNSVKKVWDEGKACILDLDVRGVEQIRKREDLEPIFIFVKPPSLQVLRERLTARGDHEENIEKRLTHAKGEIQYSEIEGNFHLVVLNNDFQSAYTKFLNFILDELIRRRFLEKKNKVYKCC